MMEAASTFETSINLYQTTRHNNHLTRRFPTPSLFKYASRPVTDCEQLTELPKLLAFKVLECCLQRKIIYLLCFWFCQHRAFTLIVLARLTLREIISRDFNV
jgi:hypothetical protein